MTRIAITSPRLAAKIDPQGAELQSLRFDGEELIWGGDPAFWSGRAPILFPIVGRLASNRYRLDGESYSLAQHGFARTSVFAVVERSDDAVTFRLEDNAATRVAWPFAFRLDLRFVVVDQRLEMMAILTNTGQRDMPFSFGFHPAFRWPLPGAGARADHAMRFEQPEPAAIRRVGQDGLVTSALHPTPVRGVVLALDDSLFADDALILPGVASRGLTYGVVGRPGLRIGWRNLPDLGIWMKPGADYVCVEPWAGYASPAGFEGELWKKPGIIRLAPGARREFAMTVEAGVIV